MTWLKSIGSIAIALLVAWGWLHFLHDPGVRADAARVARLDSLKLQAHADSTVAAARDSTARADSVKAAHDLAGAQAITATIALAAKALVPRLRQSVADSAKAVFDSLVRFNDSTVAATARERDVEHARWGGAVAALAFQRDTVIPKLRQDLPAAVQPAPAAPKSAGRPWQCGVPAGLGAPAPGGVLCC